MVGAFYIMGAATTFLTGVIFSLDNHYIFALLMLEREQTVPMFGGAIISVFFYVSALPHSYVGFSHVQCHES